LPGEDRAEGADCVPHPLLVGVLEKLEVDVLILGEGEASPQEVVCGLGDARAPLGDQKPREQALTLDRAGIALGRRRQHDSPWFRAVALFALAGLHRRRFAARGRASGCEQGLERRAMLLRGASILGTVADILHTRLTAPARERVELGVVPNLGAFPPNTSHAS